MPARVVMSYMETMKLPCLEVQVMRLNPVAPSRFIPLGIAQMFKDVSFVQSKDGPVITVLPDPMQRTRVQAIACTTEAAPGQQW